MSKFHISTQILQGNALFSGKNYTTGKNFTRPPVATVATNFRSAKTTFFCLIGPKVSFWLAFHCTNYTKADNFTFFLVFLLSLATSGEARKIGFWQCKCTLGPVHTLTHIMPLEKLKNEQTFSNYEASTPPTITSCKEYIALKINCFPAN